MPLWQLIVIGLIAGFAVVGIALLLPRKHCPDCRALLPAVRKPVDMRQAMMGGWTCPQCGCRIDRRGKKIPAETATPR